MTEDEEIEETLRRQDEALVLLERLRIAEPAAPVSGQQPGGGRRDFPRWPIPAGVTVEGHNGERWQPIVCTDLGIGGARLTELPKWLAGPTPIRLKAAGPAVLALSDLMWRDSKTGTAGLRFEFQDPEERDQWTALLIDALLARYQLG